MSLVKPEDFAKALNISYGTIRSKLSRKGLLRNRKGLIDTENPKNYIYILEINGGDQSVFEEYHQGVISKANISKKSISPTVKSENVKNNLKSGKNEKISENEKPSKINASGSKLQAVDTKIKPEKKVVEKLTLEEKKEKESQRKANETLLSMEIRKKQADLSVVEFTADIKKAQLEKLAGNTLPLDVTKTLLKVNLQYIMKTFKAELENIATISVEALGGSREDLVRIINEQDVMLSKLIKIAKTNADTEIERIVTEYAEVRSRGERK